MQLAENIKRMRKEKRMTQEQLAEALGVTVGAVYKWERALSTPDLSLIVALADLFSVSVDALLGHEMHSGAAKDVEERIHRLQRAKNFAPAAAEAERALTRYPNDFFIVYRCAEMYMLKGVETQDKPSFHRAIGLFEHAILLLSQNTDPNLCEASIQAEIAQCHIFLKEKDKGLELLKRYNVGGIHDSLIGHTYAVSEEYPPSQAAPYLTKAFMNCFRDLLQTMIGYVNCYDRLGDHPAAMDALLWTIGYLDSIRAGEGSCYADKFIALLLAECAHHAYLLGRTQEIQSYLEKAFCAASRFDASPAYNMNGLKFCTGSSESATGYDDTGETAVGAIQSQMERESWHEEIVRLWKEVIHERA